MDWFSWLSKTGLDPSLVYEYGLVLSHNELEEEDVRHFNHEFLQSMGISIAKHRLEILKLAKKSKRARKIKNATAARTRSKIMLAIKRTRRCLGNYIKTLIGCDEEYSSLAVVPISSMPTSSGGSSRSWKSAVVKRNKRLVMSNNDNNNNNYYYYYNKKQERLLLTNGTTALVPSTPLALPCPHHEGFSSVEKMVEDDDGYWSSAAAAAEDIRWDTMFQDLKPN